MGKKEKLAKSEDGGASPGKIFVGGLPRDIKNASFLEHFGQYGEIVDSVIMKDKRTSQLRGFGFVTYADPAVVNKVIEDIHVIDGKQVEIKRIIPKGATRGAAQSKDFKTRRIFVGGLPSTLTDDDFKNFFSKHGTVIKHQIIRDRQTQCSRGFGFIVFDSEKAVDAMLATGNMINLAGSQVEIKKAEPKKSSKPPPSAYGRHSRDHSFADNYGGMAGMYSNYSAGGFGPYRNNGGFGGSYSAYGVMGGWGGGYSHYHAGLGGYGGVSSFGYPNHFWSYGGASGGAYPGGALGGYRCGGGESSGGYHGASIDSSSYGGAYDSKLGGKGSGGGAPHSSRGGSTGGSGRYHPYGR